MEDLNKLLKDLTNYDPHIRQNAVRFLSQQYLDDNKRNALKEDDKSKIVTGLLSRLELSEDSLEVKGCTVKNFGLISKFLKENEIIQIFSKIITFITDPKAVGKDIYVTCIKSIFKEMNGTSCHTVGKVIIPEILKGIQSKNIEIQELCFDAFNDYINTFNYVLIKESESVIKNKDSIVSIAINTIPINNQSLRNRVSSFIGNFSVILNKSQLSSMLEGLITKIKSSTDISEKIALLTSLNSAAKNTANRHVDIIKHVLPLIFEFCNREYLERNINDYDLNNDLVECGLGIIETYILKLSNLMKNDTERIVRTVLDLMEYDPNFNYSDENEDSNNIDYNDYANEYEGYEAFVFGDDSSWKVRRASVRVIASFIKSRAEIPRDLVEVIIQSMVFNLREHEETTKLDIISCLSNFLRNLVIGDSDNTYTNINSDLNASSNNDSLYLSKQKSFTNFIPMIINKLVESIIKELKGKNQKIKSAILQLLSSLALVDSGDLVIRFTELQPYIEPSLKENISALTFFVFLTRFLKSLKKCPEVTLLIDDLIKYVIIGMKNDFYKINIQSLNVAFHLIRLIVESLTPEEYKPKIEILLKELLPKFKANDVDQELKLTLISTIGNIILYIGHHMDSKNIDEIFSIFLDKTKNENLRPLVFNWLIKIIKNNSQLRLDSALPQFIPIILELLSKNIVHVQYQTLEFLSTILNYCPVSVYGSEVKIVEAMLNLTNEDSLTSLIYDILNQIIKTFKIPEDILEKTIAKTLKILDDSKYSGTSLHSIFNYIENFTKLIDKSKLNTYAYSILNLSNMNYNKAKSIAILAKAAGTDTNLISNLIDRLSPYSKLDDGTKKNVILCLGELSLLSDASTTNKKLLQDLEKMLIKSNEDLRSSIAICIGKVGVRYPTDFIENIISNNNKDIIAYHFVSIREFLNVISALDSQNKNKIDLNNIKSLFKILTSCSNDQDEKLRILCGENLGLISLLNEDLFKQYISYMKNDDSVTRATFFYGLKYIFSNKHLLENYLDILLDLLMMGLCDSDIVVKQNAFNSLINFAHNFGVKIKSRFVELFNVFKKEHIINQELIATVDIGGGLKIKNDKGLPIRKAIYSILKILLDVIPEKINVTETLQICLYGLEDNNDVQALCHGCLLKISHLAPEAYITILDLLVDSFKKKVDLLKRTTAEGVNDSKKLTDHIININRLFSELKKVQEIAENPKFVDLFNEISKQI